MLLSSQFRCLRCPKPKAKTQQGSTAHVEWPLRGCGSHETTPACHRTNRRRPVEHAAHLAENNGAGVVRDKPLKPFRDFGDVAVEGPAFHVLSRVGQAEAADVIAEALLDLWGTPHVIGRGSLLWRG